MSPELKKAVEAFAGGKSPVFAHFLPQIQLRDPVVENIVFRVLKHRSSTGDGKPIHVQFDREHGAIKLAVDTFKELLQSLRIEYPEEVCGDVAKEILDLQTKLADQFEQAFQDGAKEIRAVADKKLAKAVYEEELEEWKSAREQYVAEHTVAGLASIPDGPDRVARAIEQVSKVFEALFPPPTDPSTESEQPDEG